MMGVEAIWNLILTLAIGAVGYLLKELKNTIDKQLSSQSEQMEKMGDKNEKRFRELEKEFSNLRADLPGQYVNRDDFVRAISGLDNRLDKGLTTISKQIQELMTQKKGG